MSKSSEQCVFCGWNRRTCWANIKFFSIPREPGLKKIRWLQTFGNRTITHRDRVCSVHFRAGRPSNDASHEDFVPHLYLSNEPPAEVMDYFELQGADKASDSAKILAAAANVEANSSLVQHPVNQNNDKNYKLLPLLPKKNRILFPAIMQRKRKQIKDELFEEEFVGPDLFDDDEAHPMVANNNHQLYNGKMDDARNHHLSFSTVSAEPIMTNSQMVSTSKNAAKRQMLECENLSDGFDPETL